MIPRDNQRHEKENVCRIEKPNDFYFILRGPIKASLFPVGSRMGSQGTVTWTKQQNAWHVEKNHREFLLNFIKSYQGITFSTSIQDGTPKGNQGNKNGNAWQAEKNLNAFLLNSERSFQDSVFSDKDPGCDPKGYSKARKGKCLSSRKSPATFYWILEAPIRASIFPPGSRMWSQGTAKWKK